MTTTPTIPLHQRGVAAREHQDTPSGIYGKGLLWLTDANLSATGRPSMTMVSDWTMMGNDYAVGLTSPDSAHSLVLTRTQAAALRDYLTEVLG